MKHTEHEYIDAGYRMERGTLSMSTVRHMLESERIEDRAEARRLIERGRQEALAETELVQEPVCWSITYNGSHVGNVYESRAYAEERMADLNSKYPGDTRTIEPLYTAPNAQQPAPPANVPMLTEILHAIDDAAVLADFAECWIKDPSIEGMHRLKNGGVKFRLLAQAVRQKAGPT